MDNSIGIGANQAAAIAGGPVLTAYDQLIMSFGPDYYLRLDEADGATTVVDLTGNNNGTVLDTSLDPAEFVSGPAITTDGGGSMLTDRASNNRVVKLLGSENYNPQTLSVVTWVNPAGTVDNEFFLNNWDGLGGFLMFWNGGQVEIFIHDGAADPSPAIPLVRNTDNLLVMTYTHNGSSGAVQNWKNNGVDAGSDVLGGSGVTANTTPITIGAAPSGLNGFVGTQARVALIPSVLTQANVQAIHAAGTA
jgi:hypothetical protein